jgi:FAD synthetase
LVLLVLILACLPAWASQPTTADPGVVATNLPAQSTIERPLSSNTAVPSRPLQAIYIVSPHPFAEVEDFVARSAEQYYLDLKRYSLPMRPALEAYLEDEPAVKAIFLGTRRTDPHGEFLTHFDPTDEGWPQIMRVHPVIDWHYVEIWAVSPFLLPTPYLVGSR